MERFGSKSSIFETSSKRKRFYKKSKKSFSINLKKIMDEKTKLSRKKRQKISAKDFTPIKVIGKGAFGEVRLCKNAKNEYVAIKKLKIDDMIQKNQIKHILAEREVLLKANNDWVVNLHYCFKDRKYLYLGKIKVKSNKSNGISSWR